MQFAGLAVVVLALMGALALACFAKVIGVVYLGTPRHVLATDAHESAGGMIRPLVGLAAACVVIGLVPIAVVPPALRVGSLVAGLPAGTADFTGVTAAGPATVFTVALALSLLLAWGLYVALRLGGRPAQAATWGCGYPTPTPRMAYASSFAAPLLEVFRSFAGVRTRRTAQAFATHPVDPVLDEVLVPAW